MGGIGIGGRNRSRNQSCSGGGAVLGSGGGFVLAFGVGVMNDCA
jgi:hypothetical protein